MRSDCVARAITSAISQHASNGPGSSSNSSLASPRLNGIGCGCSKVAYARFADGHRREGSLRWIMTTRRCECGVCCAVTSRITVADLRRAADYLESDFDGRAL